MLVGVECKKEKSMYCTGLLFFGWHRRDRKSLVRCFILHGIFSLVFSFLLSIEFMGGWVSCAAALHCIYGIMRFMEIIMVRWGRYR